MKQFESNLIISSPFLLSGSLFTQRPSHTVSIEVTVAGLMGLQLIFQPVCFIRVTIYPKALPHKTSRGLYLPCTICCLALACIKAIIHFQSLSFCHDTVKPKQKETAIQFYRLFTIIKISHLFLNPAGSLMTFQIKQS